MKQLVTREQKIISKVLIFIFNPFDSYDGDIEVPELFQEAAESGLICKRADKKGFTILQGKECQITQPIGEMTIQGFFNPYVICVLLVKFILILSALLID